MIELDPLSAEPKDACVSPQEHARQKNMITRVSTTNVHGRRNLLAGGVRSKPSAAASPSAHSSGSRPRSKQGLGASFTSMKSIAEAAADDQDDQDHQGESR